MKLLQRWVTARFVATPRVRTEEVAREIAQRTRPTVLDRVGNRPLTMDRFEARGYVWARAALPVHRELDALLAQRRDLRGALRGTIIRMATEQVVHLVLDDLCNTATAPVSRRMAG